VNSHPTPATPEDLELFGSLRDRRCPPGRFIGDGAKVVRRMLARVPVEKILCSPEWPGRLEIPDGVEVRIADRGALDAIVGCRLHQRIMAIARIPPPPPLAGTLFVALDGLSNTENVGAVLRTCAAFGVDAILASADSASPWHRRAMRTSMGAPLVVPPHVVDDLPAALRPLRAYAAHIHGERVDFRDVDYRGPVCLVLGGEAEGVRPATLAACRGAITIPMAPEWDCLNVASSAAVLLAEVQRQRRG
jgi:tRNA G18 (ribose-2'-O)-methylase SpoU